VKMPLVITEEMMKQDPFFEMGLKEGIEKGKEIGLKEGIKKGLKEGERRAKRFMVEKLMKKGMG